MPATSEGWERRIFARIAALPDSAEPLQRAQILAALVAGTELNRLHRLARRLHLNADLEPAVDALARGQTTATNTALARLDQSLATVSLRWLADRFGLLRYVWNPPLFVCGVYVIVLATIVLCCAN